MSVSSVGSGSIQPANYSYPSGTLPTGLAYGAAPQPNSSTAATASSASSSYEADYQSLQQYDDQELMQVSLGSAAAAASNVDSVLAQAAALQSQETAAQNAAAAADANGAIQGSSSSASTSSSANDPLNIPSYQSIITQSDTDALNVLNSSLGIGSSGTSNSLGATGSTVDTTA
jgi:hypothetical protein